MPNDLLRYLAGPSGYSPWWWLLVAALIIAVAGWFAGVVAWTLPPLTLRSNRFLGPLNRRLVARRFVRTVQTTNHDYRAGSISARQAVAAHTRTLRNFLHVATGQLSHVMHISDLASGELAPASSLIAAMDTTRFGSGAEGHIDVELVGRSVEETIRSWP